MWYKLSSREIFTLINLKSHRFRLSVLIKQTFEDSKEGIPSCWRQGGYRCHRTKSCGICISPYVPGSHSISVQDQAWRPHDETANDGRLHPELCAKSKCDRKKKDLWPTKIIIYKNRQWYYLQSVSNVKVMLGGSCLFGMAKTSVCLIALAKA